ncbi:MAG TPA: aspartyl protease family protein [Vicinamibacterales bacterium]|nr:aspartyl protease family protein [Vicinamibacterales bacterium]
MFTRIRLSSAVCLAATIAFGVPHDGTAGTADGQVIPFESPRGTLIAVRGAIGRLDGLRLLVDTGTSRTVVDRRIVRELGLRGTPDHFLVFGQRVPAERVALPELRLGPIHAPGLQVLAADLSAAGQRLGWPLDAIVGLDVLREHCFIVDYQSRTLAFTCTADWPWKVACDRRSPYLIAPVVIDGRELRLFVDTGSDALAIYERAAAEGAAPGEEGVPADNLVTTVYLRHFTADSVIVGGLHLRRELVFVAPGRSEDLGYDGVLGVPWLASRVQIDLSRVQIDLETLEISWGK